MYKPVPLIPPQQDEDESECESMLNSVSHDDFRNEEQSEHSAGKSAELSTFRKIALFLSILNCIAFVVIFLWVLPCEHNSCKSFDMSLEKEWEVDFNEQGTWLLQVAPAVSNNKGREVIVVANSKLFSNMQDVSLLCMIGNSTGIIGVRAMDGKVLWRLNSTDNLHYINCTIVDLNKNGISDCLLYDQSNGLRAIDTLKGSLLWNTNLSSIGYDTASVVVKDIQTAILDIDNISDLLLLLTDMESLTLAGVSGRNGALLWHHRLHANCSLKRNNEQTISEVVRSVSCLNSTDLIGITTKPLKSEHRNESTKLEISSCQKCAAFVSGIPSSRYVLHKGLKDYLLVAHVNCTGLQTQLKKTHI